MAGQKGRSPWVLWGTRARHRALLVVGVICALFLVVFGLMRGESAAVPGLGLGLLVVLAGGALYGRQRGRL